MREKKERAVCLPLKLLALVHKLDFFIPLSHRSRGKSRDVKKCRAKLRALWKSAHQELRNEPPHDIAVRLPQNPFLASLWIGSGLGDPEAGQKGILGWSYSFVMWGLVSKLLTHWFSWRLQFCPAFFYLPRFPSGTMCVLILVLNLIQVDHIGIEWDSSIGEILILLFNSKLRWP